LIWLVSLSCFAEIRKLDKKLQGMTLEMAQMIRKQNMVYTDSDEVKTKQSGIKQFNNKHLRPYFSDSVSKIRTLDQFYVRISGNLKIMGDAFERIKVVSESKMFPKGSYFSCNSYNSAIQYHYRIKFKCDKLITPNREFQINAHIKDLKKISGVTPDHVSTTEEEGLIKQFVLGLTAHMLESDKSRRLTDSGYKDEPTDSNALKDAAIDGVKNINSELSSKDSKTIVLAMIGQKKAIIEFLEPFNFSEEIL
jgi:hypothetical protein